MTQPVHDRVEPIPRLLDITHLAELLDVNPRHVRRLVFERRIPFIKWGHLIRFDPAEIETWLREARVPARPGGPS
jgi:excisionase family DNA binding protein